MGTPRRFPERVEVIYSRKALAVLPFIDGAGLLKAEIALDVPNRQPAFDAQAADIVPVAARSMTGKNFVFI